MIRISGEGDMAACKCESDAGVDAPWKLQSDGAKDVALKY